MLLSRECEDLVVTYTRDNNNNVDDCDGIYRDTDDTAENQINKSAWKMNF